MLRREFDAKLGRMEASNTQQLQFSKLWSFGYSYSFSATGNLPIGPLSESSCLIAGFIAAVCCGLVDRAVLGLAGRIIGDSASRQVETGTHHHPHQTVYLLLPRRFRIFRHSRDFRVEPSCAGPCVLTPPPLMTDYSPESFEGKAGGNGINYQALQSKNLDFRYGGRLQHRRKSAWAFESNNGSWRS